MASKTIKAVNDIIFPEKEILDFIYKNVEKLKGEIISNLNSTGKNTTGKTAQSLKINNDSSTVELIGRGYFEELETGTPPRAQPANFQQIIKEWAEAKGIPIMTEDKLNQFAYQASNKIQQVGSKDYREGRRTNIYSDEVQDCWQKIDDFIDTKIEWFLKTIEL